MLNAYVKVKNFLDSKKGQGMVEYALIIVLIAVVVIAALRLMGTSINDIFGQITDGLSQN